MSEENVVDKEKPLEKMTVTDLREMAKDMPGIVGVHGMKKDELIAAIKEVKGIKDEPVKKTDASVAEIKKKIKAVKAQRQGALEAKDSKIATERLAEAVNIMLEYDPKIRIAIEPKPNEPMDQAYLPTTGHAISLGMLTSDPTRVGVVIESAHAILAGLDPSDEMGFALAHNKLWTVHLNDQNGLKFDQDKAFGSVDLRRAFNQVRILDKHDYGQNGEWVGLDVKAMRTQKDDVATKHLSNSREIFLKLLEISRSIDESYIQKCVTARDYEELDLFIMKTLLA